MAIAMHLRLRDERHAPAIARRTAASILRGTAPVDVEMVSLLVNELVVRVRQRALSGEPIDVRLKTTAALLRVTVAAGSSDGGGERPEEPEGLNAGWTLLMIDRVADRWGVDDGRAVRIWFEIDMETVEVP